MGKREGQPAWMSNVAAIGQCALVALMLSALVSCGGDDAATTQKVGDLDASDPEQVVRAMFSAEFRCGDEGAGLQYDLALPVQRGRATREEQLKWEKRNGCSPRPVPRFNAVRGSTTGARTFYEVHFVNPESPDDDSALMVVVQSQGRWWWDIVATNEAGGEIGTGLRNRNDE